MDNIPDINKKINKMYDNAKYLDTYGGSYYGTILLLTYGLSMTLPFVITAIFAKPFLRWMHRKRYYIQYVEKVMGAMLIVFGLLIASNSVNYLANLMIKYAPWFSSIG